MDPDKRNAWLRKLDEECPYQVVLPRRQLSDDSAIMNFLTAYVGKFDMYVEDEYAIFVRYCFEDPLAALGASTSAKAQAPSKRFIKREASERSGYSQAVVTQGGRTVWLAGMTGAVDQSGKSLAGDFEAQVRETFAFIERTLAQADAKLSDLVTMTVFLTDARNHPRMTAIRREILGKDFPASASISISHLANPNALIEIQAVAVIA
jgi:2-iminobutanoate/2-iminopropanoate deaminase